MCHFVNPKVHIIRAPSLAELGRELAERRPNFLYLSSGIIITGDGSHVNDITLKPLEFRGDNGEKQDTSLSFK